MEKLLMVSIMFHGQGREWFEEFKRLSGVSDWTISDTDATCHLGQMTVKEFDSKVRLEPKEMDQLLNSNRGEFVTFCRATQWAALVV